MISLSVKDQHYRCNLKEYLCQIDKQAKAPNELLAPNGKQAVFIQDHNLWLRDIASNEKTQLTSDGIENFGYSTNNAGWIRRSTPVVKWSPDSKKLTTFKHDGRKVGEMGIVSSAVGHPKIDVWKYPLPGDEHIFKIHRVVIDIAQGKVTALDMPADDHENHAGRHDRDADSLDRQVKDVARGQKPSVSDDVKDKAKNDKRANHAQKARVQL